MHRSLKFVLGVFLLAVLGLFSGHSAHGTNRRNRGKLLRANGLPELYFAQPTRAFGDLHMPHEAWALEDTLDLDVFTPPREDWLDKTDDYLRKGVPQLEPAPGRER